LQRSQRWHGDVREIDRASQRSRRQPICLQNKGTLLRGRASDTYMRNFKKLLHACTAYVLNIYLYVCIRFMLK